MHINNFHFTAEPALEVSFGSGEPVSLSIELKEMIHYSLRDLAIIEFTDQGPSIRKESSPRL